MSIAIMVVESPRELAGVALPSASEFAQWKTDPLVALIGVASWLEAVSCALKNEHGTALERDLLASRASDIVRGLFEHHPSLTLLMGALAQRAVADHN